MQITITHALANNKASPLVSIQHSSVLRAKEFRLAQVVQDFTPVPIERDRNVLAPEMLIDQRLGNVNLGLSQAERSATNLNSIGTRCSETRNIFGMITKSEED